MGGRHAALQWTNSQHVHFSAQRLSLFSPTIVSLVPPVSTNAYDHVGLVPAETQRCAACSRSAHPAPYFPIRSLESALPITCSHGVAAGTLWSSLRFIGPGLVLRPPPGPTPDISRDSLMRCS